MTSTGFTGTAVRAAGLAVLTVAAWWGWLGWQAGDAAVDPATGSASGPYRPWQVAGCVVSLAVLAVAGGMLLRPWIVVVVMTAVFTTCWALHAARADDSGLWAVGALGVLIGTALGSGLLSGLARLLRRGD